MEKISEMAARNSLQWHYISQLFVFIFNPLNKLHFIVLLIPVNKKHPDLATKSL